ncbi:hypothetical protein [Nocardia carnea]|uniref:hypothetical protein n=1 Tax=Nocardia carnea TaxID=37328 RepID=UPI00030F10D0|nr:hypothetical protein [Nocardia carnea]
MDVIEYDYLRSHLSQELKKAYHDDGISVVAYLDHPVGVLMSRGVWALGQQEKSVPRTLMDEPLNSRAARPKLRVLRERLEKGRHITLTVWDNEAIIAPYDWAREAFPDWDLPEVLQPAAEATQGENCVQVVYRAPRTVAKLRKEFADAEDPEWEMDRRLSATRSYVPADRRARMRGVVYVEGGRIVRIRALDPDGEWTDLGDRVSLAPVSAPLTREEVDSQLPGLKLYPGDLRLAPRGASREYLDY